MEQVLYSLPDGWNYQKLKTLIKMHYGKALKAADRIEGEVPVYGSNGVVGSHNEHLWDQPTVVIGRKGSVGEANLAYTPSWTIDTAYYVEIIDHEVLNLMYFYYFADRFDVSSISQKGVKPGINRNDYLNLSFPLPPLNEQERIVEKLDALLTRIDTAIEHLQESVALKSSLLQSALDGQFAAITDRMTIESLTEVKGGKRLPKGEKLSDEETEHPYIRVADFTDKGTIDLSDIKYISKKIHEQIKRYVISKDDLYISIAGTIGKTGFVPPELDGANLTENAAKLVIKDKQQLDLNYLYLFTLTSDFSAQAGLATKTVAQPKLALTRLSKIEIPMSSLGEQKALVSTIETLKSKIHDAEEVLLGKIEDLKSLKASILDSAFKGEL
ncbi:restriction endonuclease subunit S [Jinshanibacter sp. LJY008]|uniref:Restriction endonuclease subunit S n=1 Tax=Limnobaculum eriocheiris TaxID=2897391 RepID=A0A9X1MX01_9GAMM|nr:restriction endonuclease subunit S [Limnobaculum eriocheiris]MCD1127136.1 restriction endonuclease subunit S [Limnobaculum eriocheiris]